MSWGFGFDCCCDGVSGCRLFTSSWETLSLFTQVAGVWTVDDPYIETGDSDALLISNYGAPSATNDVVISAVLGGTNQGDKVRVVFDYVDASTYKAVELSLGTGGGTQGEVRVLNNGSAVGADLPLRIAHEDGEIAVQIWWKPEEESIRVKVYKFVLSTEPIAQFTRTAASNGGKKVGLGTGAMTGDLFSYGVTLDFFNRLDSNGDDVCPSSFDCTIHRDDFGSDSTNENTNPLLSEWEVLSGTWLAEPIPVIGSPLQALTPAGMIVSRVVDFAETAHYEVSVDILDPGGAPGILPPDTEDHVWGLIFDYVDSDNYHCAKWKSYPILDAGSAIVDHMYTITVHKVAGGADTQLWEFIVGPASNMVVLNLMRVCVRDDIAWVQAPSGSGFVGGPSGSMNIRIEPHGGTRAGILVENTPSTQVDFINWLFAVTTEGCPEEDDPEFPCIPCWSNMATSDDFKYVPYAFQVVIAGVTSGTCPDAGVNLNGTFITQPMRHALFSYTGQWEHTFPLNGLCTPEISVNLTVEVRTDKIVLYLNQAQAIILGANDVATPSPHFELDITGLCDLNGIDDELMTLLATTPAGKNLSGATARLTAIPSPI